MAETAAYIIDVNESNINDVLQQSMQKPVLLDFWAAWCEPCKTLAPILTKIADEYKGKFILAKIDADASPAITQQLGVRGLPTLKLVVQGQLVNELTGEHESSKVPVVEALGRDDAYDLVVVLIRKNRVAADEVVEDLTP